MSSSHWLSFASSSLQRFKDIASFIRYRLFPVTLCVDQQGECLYIYEQLKHLRFKTSNDADEFV